MSILLAADLIEGADWDPSVGGELRVEERQPRGSQSALELPTAG